MTKRHYRPGDLARNADLAAIHIRKAELMAAGVIQSDDEYRDLLHAICNGKRSSADLDFAERKTVMDHFQRLARASNVTLKSLQSNRTGVPRRAPADRAALLGKINAQLLDQGLTVAYLEHAAEGKESMLRRLAGVDKLEFAPPDGLKKVIAAIVYHARRKAAA